MSASGRLFSPQQMILIATLIGIGNCLDNKILKIIIILRARLMAWMQGVDSVGRQDKASLRSNVAAFTN